MLHNVNITEWRLIYGRYAILYIIGKVANDKKILACLCENIQVT
jgi:hypothetical protein